MLREINSECLLVSPRWEEVREMIDYKVYIQNAYNLSFDFDSRRFSRKYLAAELLRYLSWNRNTSKVWEYASMRKRISNEDWYANSNYWYITLFHEIDDYWNQYDYVLEKLIEDKDTRQALIRYNSHEHVYKWNKDFVCTISNQFFIRDNKLQMIVNMRSNDVFYWFQYDLVRFWLLMQSIFIDLKSSYPELEIWTINYSAGSMHIYSNMFSTSEKILLEPHSEAIDYRLKLKSSMSSIKNIIINNEQMYRDILEQCKNYKKFIEEMLFIDITKIP